MHLNKEVWSAVTSPAVSCLSDYTNQQIRPAAVHTQNISPCAAEQVPCSLRGRVCGVKPPEKKQADTLQGLTVPVTSADLHSPAPDTTLLALPSSYSKEAKANQKPHACQSKSFEINKKRRFSKCAPLAATRRSLGTGDCRTIQRW